MEETKRKDLQQDTPSSATEKNQQEQQNVQTEKGSGAGAASIMDGARNASDRVGNIGTKGGRTGTDLDGQVNK